MTERELKKIKTKQRRVWSPLYIISLAVLILYAVILIGLLYWGFMTSLKDNQTDFRINVMGLPKKWKWSNYQFIMDNFNYVITDRKTGSYVRIGMLEMARNSIFYSVGCTLATVFSMYIMAYAVGRFPYKLSSIIFVTNIITMIIPIVGTGGSGIQIVRWLNFYDNFFGIFFMSAGFRGMYFIMFVNIFRTLPEGYVEAAKLDGAGNWKIFIEIITPLTKNILFTILVLNFIGYWNAYTTALLYLPSYPTIALAVWKMSTTNINSLATTPMRMCGAMILFVPTFLIFLSMHKKFLGNLQVGGLKG